MNLLLYLIIIPFIVGLFCLVVPKKLSKLRDLLAIGGGLATLYFAIISFLSKPVDWFYNGLLLLKVDNLSGFILLAIGLFGVLIVLYSLKYMAGKKRLNEYYAYLLWTIGGACGAILANNLVLLLVFWGFLGLTLYLLIGIGGPEATSAAKKTFIIVGGSDCLFILGIGIIWLLTGSFQMDNISVSLMGTLPTIAFISLAIASFAKAGVMPMHTWIPDMAMTAPVSITGFLPGSLDKLLGIYFLARISIDIFVMNNPMGKLLLIIGAVTIVGGVMMALVQHDLKRLLSYHAVSQAGYMVLGIGTGNPIGIAGGLFHMLNNAIYKFALFLSGGAVENKARTTDLDRLGGLAKLMPITFITCLIAALSISGVPPFNGFVSKWMVYQGVIELGKGGDKLWIVWLVAAMFGSALTLASFMKLIHCVFLGSPSATTHSSGAKRNEVSFAMWFPMVILAVLCITFGVFAYSVPLKNLILSAVPGVSFLGFWSPGLATLLIIMGIILGLIVYFIGNIKSVRLDTTYVGGEIIPRDSRVSGVEFYDTIKDLGTFKTIYGQAEKKLFDIYDWGAKFIFFLIRGLRRIHSGALPMYLFWSLFGMLVLFIIMMLRI
jgi:formate hydrogenlyase subunit 3/multisubunit Na+/H+ antiporter MnhD subunit